MCVFITLNKCPDKLLTYLPLISVTTKGKEITKDLCVLNQQVIVILLVDKYILILRKDNSYH